MEIQVANQKYGNQTGLTSMKVISRLVAEEGKDAAAEERIVMRLCQMQPPKKGIGWINTEFMRSRIRKVQGRKRVR